MQVVIEDNGALRVKETRRGFISQMILKTLMLKLTESFIELEHVAGVRKEKEKER